MVCAPVWRDNHRPLTRYDSVTYYPGLFYFFALQPFRVPPERILLLVCLVGMIGLLG